jgi:beta-lactam-binding protein with PASTA domain
VFENILNEEVANVTVDLKLASQGLEAAKREGLPLLFIFHKRDDNRQAIGKWNLLLAQHSHGPNAVLPQIARSFVTIALPLDELPALSRQVGVEPYLAPDNATPLFIVADSSGMQKSAITGWHREEELTRAMAWGLIGQAGRQDLPMPQLRSLLKLVRQIDDRMTASVMTLIRQATQTSKSSSRDSDTAVLLKHAPDVEQVVALPKIEAPVANYRWDSSGFFSVVDSGVALSLPSASIGEEPAIPSTHVVMPNVAGLTHSVAVELLRARGLTVDVPNKLARIDDVVEKQSIRAGQSVERGSRVRLERIVTDVPIVLGMTLDAARRLLNETHGFRAEFDDSLSGDLVVTHQNPSGGQQSPRGEDVQLFNRRAMPTLLGMEVSAACRILEEARIPFRLDAATVNGDVVFKQQPEPGDWLNGEASASVVAGVQLPDLTGSYDHAKSKLAKMGVLGKVASARNSYALRPPFPAGQPSVYWQSIEPGQYITRSDVLQVRTVTYQRRGVGY